ncbi:MAG: hypothetical protein EP319_07400 [Deltaproteobacteria bacterium]|nr:MAG: hypothetical protein EP319_07400 [Deltaproteobacteria bacterium]
MIKFIYFVITLIVISGSYAGELNRLGLLFSIQGHSPQHEGEIHLEIQKILYKEGKWDLFFGGNLYRSIHLTNLDPNILGHLQMLEAMALSKHCLHAQAVELLSSIKKGISYEDSKTLKNYIALNADLSFLSKYSKDTLKIKKSAISKNSFWVLNQNRIKRLKSQQNLRVNLKSRCKS